MEWRSLLFFVTVAFMAASAGWVFYPLAWPFFFFNLSWFEYISACVSELFLEGSGAAFWLAFGTRFHFGRELMEQLRAKKASLATTRPMLIVSNHRTRLDWL